MTVKLISVSQPVIPECKTAEELIVYCARVSNPANQTNMQTADKLLKYMIKHHHWSPFEMVNVTMEIKTTRDISRQILRHRSFSFQEFSQRYAQATEFNTDRECRLQDTKNRQNSLDNQDYRINQEWEDIVSEVLYWADSGYQQLLSMGVAKEVARAILPEGLTYSTLYMSGTLRSWIHYCNLRRGPETQKEHRQIADQCWSILKQQFPIITTAVEEYNNNNETVSD